MLGLHEALGREQIIPHAVHPDLKVLEQLKMIGHQAVAMDHPVEAIV
jgi:hypothetical protein